MSIIRMVQRHNIKRLLFLSVMLAVAAGCGRDGIPRVAVSGDVQFDGLPIANGQVMFYPIEGTRGSAYAVPIVEGTYTAREKGGVPVGRHRIMIEAYRRPTVIPPGVKFEDLGREQYLPAKYNSHTELTTELTEDESPATRNYSLTP